MTRTLEFFCQDDLLAELDELVQVELDQSLLDIEGTENVSLPNVPSTSLPSRPGKSLMWDILQSMFGRDFRQFWSGKVSVHVTSANSVLKTQYARSNPLVSISVLSVFLAIKAKKEEDDDDMEDLQRWAMEAI